MPLRHPLREQVQSLLDAAGVRIDGPQPWDMQVGDGRLFARLLAGGSLALGESYMDGLWEADSLDGFLFRLLDARVDERARGLPDIADGVRARLLNLQAGRRSFEVGERHYDIGNDFYRHMLGSRMVYSCGYWRRPGQPQVAGLDEAQEAKLDLVCRKLGLQPGMHVLDIGCGWGEALRFAAERHGVTGVGITVSREQAAYARTCCAGLPVDIRVEDYRAHHGRYDRILSIGMFEHVGVRNYRDYFDMVRRCLAEDAPGGGLFLLHTIGRDRSAVRTDPWIARYIFPNSMLPSAAQVAEATEGRLVIEDWHNFGADYDLTLQAWRANIEAAWREGRVRSEPRFQRMWRYYLAGAMASFRARRNQLWQLVLSPRGVPGGYVAPR